MCALNQLPQNDPLSKRAVEILRLLAEGLSDREIAERLVVTINTVKWYNRQIYSILDVGSRTQAIARARELQLLEEDEEPAPLLHIIQRKTPVHNLPVETTQFVGRKHEMDAIKHLLEATHLLTLVGAPGTGKTRLALRAAWEMVDSFADGVYFVSLAPVTDPAMVINTIASTIGVIEAKGQPLIEKLKHALRDSHMLLILDNFEHLLAAAPQVSELLAAAPYLKVLATSREPLHLYGEQEYAVSPLDVPDLDNLSLQQVSECESTALFLRRAQAVRSDFRLTEENIAEIAKICIKLEGLPLPIELAAARIKLLTPANLLARLTSRLDTLTGGAQDLPTRHRTLRNTIEWSYNLLDEGEKCLFARMSIFRGGCSLEAVEAVCSEDDVFDELESLVHKSLIQQTESPDGELRFMMLETIHEYAWEQLAASGETLTLRQRHLRYFLGLAESGAPELRQSGFSYWMTRFETEIDNFHAALEWSLDGGEVESGLQLVVALRDFWTMSSRFVQGQAWAQRALAQSSAFPPHQRIGILTAMGVILHYSSQDRPQQKQVLDEAIALAHEADDKMNLGWALVFSGTVAIGKRAQYEEGLATIEEGLSIFRALGFKPGMAQAFNSIGELARTYGDDEYAQTAYLECMRLAQETGEKRREAMSMNNLGCVMMRRGEIAQAEQLFKQALTKRLQVGHDRRGAITNLLFLAGAIAASGDVERAARLFGAAAALLEPMGVGLEPGDQPEYDRDLALVRTQLDDETFQQCWKEGRTLSLEQAVAYALEPEPL